MGRKMLIYRNRRRGIVVLKGIIELDLSNRRSRSRKGKWLRREI